MKRKDLPYQQSLHRLYTRCNKKNGPLPDQSTPLDHFPSNFKVLTVTLLSYLPTNSLLLSSSVKDNKNCLQNNQKWHWSGVLSFYYTLWSFHKSALTFLINNLSFFAFLSLAFLDVPWLCLTFLKFIGNSWCFFPFFGVYWHSLTLHGMLHYVMLLLKNPDFMQKFLAYVLTPKIQLCKNTIV